MTDLNGLIRKIRYPKHGADTRQGAAHRDSSEIAAMNLQAPEAVQAPQSAFFNRYFNGGS